MKLKPLADRVIVQPVEETDQKSTGGIIIPDTAKEKPQMGKVVAVGPGKVSDEGSIIKLSVKTGDKVLYSKYGGTEVTFDDVDYLIMSESDILATIS